MNPTPQSPQPAPPRITVDLLAAVRASGEALRRIEAAQAAARRAERKGR